MLCTIGIDEGRSTEDAVALGLDRARDDGLVVQLYAHIPGVTIPLDRLERTLAAARDRGLTHFTYDDFAAGRPAEAGIALSFDDASIDAWTGIADLLDAYDARVTFFIAYYDTFSPEQRAQVQALAARGHAIGSHSVRHLRAPEYAERHGIARYLEDEIHPVDAALRADGLTPITFAYPFGARTSELDRALLEEYDLVRSVSFSRDGLVVVDPCPE